MGRNFVYLIGFENAGYRDIRRVFLNEMDAISWARRKSKEYKYTLKLYRQDVNSFVSPIQYVKDIVVPSWDKKYYTELSIHERINYKSGWDIAIAREGRKGEWKDFPNRPYCKLAKCLNGEISTKICQQDYNDVQKHRFLNGGRNFVKQQF